MQGKGARMAFVARALVRPTIALAATALVAGACIYADNDEFDEPGTASESGNATVETCDGVDNDADGLVDEHSPDNASCGDCELTSTAEFTYWACTTPGDYDAAELGCAQFGAAANVASVADQAENETITPLLRGQAWLGAMRVDVGWVWEDDTAFTFFGWGEGSPSPDVARYRILISVDGSWNDVGDDGAFGFVCKAPISS